VKRSYSAEIAKLAELESFDPSAFVAEDKSVQACGDFVLALALAFNDLKDLLLGDSLLMGEVPKDRSTPSREFGAFGGSHLHVLRVLLGVLRELLFLVHAEQKTRESSCFQAIVKKLPRPGRNAWDKLVTASEANTSSDADIRFLVIAPNSVAYHYESKAIGRGFRRAFAEPSNEPFDEPLLSRGSSISTTRFYFADRAAQSYLQHSLGDQDPEHYFLKNRDLLPNIAFALSSVVTGFISSRGCAWRNVGGLKR
jgi:hypothetical protein